MERQRTNFIFNVYRGEELSKNKHIRTDVLDTDIPNAHIEITFAGIKVKTSTKKANVNPEWNETLIITELFPPLCQRIKVNLCYTSRCSGWIHSTRYIDLPAISNDGEYGFLPTFGPAFLHFYTYNDLGDGYAGKVLMSVQTEIQTDAAGLNPKNITTSSAVPIREVFNCIVFI